MVVLKKIIEMQRAFFRTDRTKSYEFRRKQLATLRAAILMHRDEIERALYADLHKSAFEAYTTEVGFVLKSLSIAEKKLKKWMKTERVKTPFYQLFTSSYIKPEPYGNTLIIGPYNYPFQLVVEPLIGAIAAGNTAIIKPSEFTVETERVLKKMINETFPESYLHVITGDAKVTSSLLDERFDYIFFTGSTRVGQIVYSKASEHLTPVTLELGGKSPTIVDRSANLRVAARRIVFAKFINAGQTCIAPDYVYVHESVEKALIEELKKAIETFYANEDDLAHIVNDSHFERLQNLIDPDKVVYGNVSDAETRRIAPTIMRGVVWEDAVMKEEIFGPILPILTYESISDVVELLKSKEKPLALYVFSNDRSVADELFDRLSFGGGAINDALMHVSNPYLPFGGVGNSGIGTYHGIYSFKAFSHMKSYVKKRVFIDPPIAYPPYTKKKERLIKRILK
ncbi:MAG: aldehyde dehydrogenase [Acholeplasmataceae bacterium]